MKSIDNWRKLRYTINVERRDKKMKQKKEDYDKYRVKLEGEELQLFLHFRKRGFNVPPKKGKGSYNRKKLERIE